MHFKFHLMKPSTCKVCSYSNKPHLSICSCVSIYFEVMAHRFFCLYGKLLLSRHISGCILYCCASVGKYVMKYRLQVVQIQAHIMPEVLVHVFNLLLVTVSLPLTPPLLRRVSCVCPRGHRPAAERPLLHVMVWPSWHFALFRVSSLAAAQGWPQEAAVLEYGSSGSLQELAT